MSFRLHASQKSVTISHTYKKIVIDTSKLSASFGNVSRITNDRDARGIGFAHAFANSSALA